MPDNRYSSAIIRQNVKNIREQIAVAARSAGRDTSMVRLVAVTKGHSVAAVEAALEADVSCLGENYVQEGLEKITQIGPLANLEWHMIGHIQSRKAKDVILNFQYVHTVDRVKIAKRLSKYCVETAQQIPVLLECNVSGEKSKFGLPSWPGANHAELFFNIELILDKPGLRVQGLMTMAPYFDDPESARPYFARLRELAYELQKRFGNTIGSELSMGMSGDFEAAVEEGATIVRIGTAIFGARA